MVQLWSLTYVEIFGAYFDSNDKAELQHSLLSFFSSALKVSLFSKTFWYLYKCKWLSLAQKKLKDSDWMFSELLARQGFYC